jgi:translation elongation factor EF-1alpha
MDAVGWSRSRFDQISAALVPMLQQAGFRSPPPPCIPLSALAGSNLMPASRPEGGALDWCGEIRL